MLTTARMSVAVGLLRVHALTRANRYNAPPSFIQKADSIRELEPISAALVTAADTLIAGAMLWLLQRSKTGLRRYVPQRSLRRSAADDGCSTDGLLSKLASTFRAHHSLYSSATCADDDHNGDRAHDHVRVAYRLVRRR
jgi:hypothetical protein